MCGTLNLLYHYNHKGFHKATIHSQLISYVMKPSAFFKNVNLFHIAIASQLHRNYIYQLRVVILTFTSSQSMQYSNVELYNNTCHICMAQLANNVHWEKIHCWIAFCENSSWQNIFIFLDSQRKFCSNLFLRSKIFCLLVYSYYLQHCHECVQKMGGVKR